VYACLGTERYGAPWASDAGLLIVVTHAEESNCSEDRTRAGNWSRRRRGTQLRWAQGAIGSFERPHYPRAALVRRALRTWLP